MNINKIIENSEIDLEYFSNRLKMIVEIENNKNKEPIKKDLKSLLKKRISYIKDSKQGLSNILISLDLFEVENEEYSWAYSFKFKKYNNITLSNDNFLIKLKDIEYVLYKGFRLIFTIKDRKSVLEDTATYSFSLLNEENILLYQSNLPNTLIYLIHEKMNYLLKEANEKGIYL